ncbi:uncharacterized protein LOC141622636 [Silene latifolia]|uniref:uncharacterized protein LOC141622636 n=1 Tax=Silene latifolia TaxID=37657 RepID=UPI003D76A974
MLKQNANNFDIVLTNVYIDEMDGFKLLEAGRELDIPVIMISASESRDIILKGVRYGAVDYLIKPIRLEVVKTIWQHVYRKKLASSRSTPLVRDHIEEEVRDGQNRTSVENDCIEEIQSDQETSKDSKENCKKERMKWTDELKEKFIRIVESLGGIDRAQPKKILELMDEPDLTREQIASHLQKVRKNWKEKQNNEQNSLVAASSSHQQPVVGNTVSQGQGGLSWLNYQRQLNYNYWQMTPSIGYTTPMFQDKPNESILQQRRMLSNGGNFMGSSSGKPIESTLQEPNMMNFMGSSSGKAIESTLQQPNMMSSGGNFMGSSSGKPIESTLQQPSMMSNGGNFMGSSSGKPIESTLQQPNMMSNGGKFMGSSSGKPIESTLQQPNMMSNGGNFMGSSSGKLIESTLQQPNMMNFMGSSSGKPIESTLLSNGGNFMGSSSSKPIESTLLSNGGNFMGSSFGNFMGPSSGKAIESSLQQPNMMSNGGNFMGWSSGKAIESTLQQQNMMSNDGNIIMGSSSGSKPEKRHIPDEQRLQLPEVVSDRGPSTYEYLLNDILDSAYEYPTLFDFSEDGNKDYRNC